jgi:hypothetical protein
LRHDEGAYAVLLGWLQDPDPVVQEHLFATAFASRTNVLSLDHALSLLA